MTAHDASGGERGAGVLTAVVVGAILLTLGAMLSRIGWDAAASSHDAYARVVSASAASSGAAAQLAVARQALVAQMAQNILDQGCRQQSGISCTQSGYDTAGTSGVRADRISGLASHSQAGWDQLQSAFAEVFRQVSPFAVVWDAYRTPSVLGYGGLLIEGRLDSGTLSAPWRGYLMMTPIQGRPITYDATTRRAVVPFEVRAYGWAYVDARTGRRVTAEVTAWSTGGIVEMTYPACPDYWRPDAICQYPQTVNVQIPPPSWLSNDPAVRWGF
jgi:hypothetical protein